MFFFYTNRPQRCGQNKLRPTIRTRRLMSLKISEAREPIHLLVLQELLWVSFSRHHKLHAGSEGRHNLCRGRLGPDDLTKEDLR
jgi:hypothetical protein